MKKYFYTKDEEKQGPFSFEELKKEDINLNTLIWFEGLDDWTTAKNILELEEILQLLPPPIQESSEIENDKQEKVEFQNSNITEFEVFGTVHPWRRLFARTVDIFTSGMILIFIFSYAFGSFFPNNVEGYIKFIENPIGAGILMYLLWIPTEAFFLYVMGTTPAKWLFGIYIKNKYRENLTLNQALSRAFQVFVFGEGFAIPLITIFTRFSAYRKLNNTRTTSWDENIGSIVIYEKWSNIKMIFSIIITISAIVIYTYINTQL